MLRAAVITAYEHLGGAEVAAARLCDGLARLGGVEVKKFVGERKDRQSNAVLFSQPGKMRQAVQGISTWLNRPESAAVKKLRGKSNRQNLLRLVAQYRPDIINLHNINQWSGLNLDRSIAVELSEIAPVVWTLHDMWPLTGCCDYDADCTRPKAECGWHKQMASGSHPFAPAGDRLVWVGPSRWMADKAEALVGTSHRVEHIPYGLDTDFFCPMDSESAREAVGLPKEGSLVFSIAQDVNARRKGMKELLEGLGEVSKAFRLVTAGRAGKGELDWPANTIHLGPIQDERLLRQVYCAADLVVVPSLEDNLPNVVLEALACATPVVAFDAGGIPDMVTDGRTGFLAPKGDSQKLGQQIQRYFKLTPGERQAMQQQCRDAALGYYSLETQASSYLQLFTELTSGH